MNDPSLFPLPPSLGRETLIKLDRHHSVKLALDPFHLNTLGDQVASGEPVPFFPVTELDAGVERLEDGKVPFGVVTQFLLSLDVLRGRRDRFEARFDQELRDLGILKVVGNVKGRVVIVAKRVDSRGRKNDRWKEQTEGDVAKDPRPSGLCESYQNYQPWFITSPELAGETHVVRRRSHLDVNRLGPALDQEDGHRRVHTKQRVKRVHEPLLLVRLNTHDRQPEVKRTQSEDQQGVRVGFTGLDGLLRGS